MWVPGGHAWWAVACQKEPHRRGLGWAHRLLDRTLVRARTAGRLPRPTGVSQPEPSPLAVQRGSGGCRWSAWCPGSLGMACLPEDRPCVCGCPQGGKGEGLISTS